MANAPKTIVDYSNLINSKFVKSKNIAPVEATITATEAHTVGTQLIYNNTLYTVTAPIAIGDTLEVGTNITTSDTITEQISEVKSDLSDKADKSTLATVESSSTASRAYAIGEYLVYNGILYEVTAAIASGGTITVGTNVAATNVGAELDDRMSYAANSVLGAHNIMPPIDLQPYGSVTLGNYTFTRNADDTITIVGTNDTTNREYGMVSRRPIATLPQNALLSGCFGGSASTYKFCISYYDANNAYIAGPLSVNGEVPITIPSNAVTWRMSIVIYANSGTINTTVEPMIRLATDTDRTFAPPAMTNRALTESLTDNTTTVISQAFTDETKYQNTGKTGDSKYMIRGGVCYLSLYVTAVNPSSSDDTYVGVNLPVPATSGVLTCGALCSAHGDTILAGVRHRDSNNLMFSGGVASRKYSGTIAYPVA